MLVQEKGQPVSGFLARNNSPLSTPDSPLLSGVLRLRRGKEREGSGEAGVRWLACDAISLAPF